MPARTDTAGAVCYKLEINFLQGALVSGKKKKIVNACLLSHNLLHSQLINI